MNEDWLDVLLTIPVLVVFFIAKNCEGLSYLEGLLVRVGDSLREANFLGKILVENTVVDDLFLGRSLI